MARNGVFQIRLTDDDRARWAAAAKAKGLTLAEWLRTAADIIAAAPDHAIVKLRPGEVTFHSPPPSVVLSPEKKWGDADDSVPEDFDAAPIGPDPLQSTILPPITLDIPMPDGAGVPIDRQVTPRFKPPAKSKFTSAKRR